MHSRNSSAGESGCRSRSQIRLDQISVPSDRQPVFGGRLEVAPAARRERTRRAINQLALTGVVYVVLFVVVVFTGDGGTGNNLFIGFDEA